MQFTKYVELFKNLESKVSLQKFIIVSLCCTIFIMSFFMYSLTTSRRTIIIPSSLNSKIEVADSYVSPEYVQIMGKYLLGLIYNFTPYTIERQFAEFSKYVPAEKFKEIKEKLDVKIQQSKASALTEYLVIDSFLLIDEGKFAIKGKLTRLVTGKVVEESDLEMEVGYNVKEGIFKIESLELLKENGFDRLSRQYSDINKSKK